MFNITPSEFMIIAVLALIVLGPERLPDMARSLGRLINKAREMTADLRESVDSISDDPSMKPLKDLGELATRPRQKLAEFAAEAEAEDRAERLARQRASAAAHEQLDDDDVVSDPAAPPTESDRSVSATDPPTTDPGTTDPETTDPGTTDPETTDPGTTDPGTTDPETTDPDPPDPTAKSPDGDTDPDRSDP